MIERKNIVAFIITTIFYGLILATGIVGMCLFYKGNNTGFLFTLFFLITCIFPCWVAYLSQHDPFEWGCKKGLFVVAITLCVAAGATYFLCMLTIDSVSEHVVLMTIVLVVIYILQFVGFCKWCQEDSSIAYIFAAIGTIVLSPLVIAWSLVYLIWYFIKLFLSMLGFTFKSALEMNSNKTFYEVYDRGSKRILERDGYDYSKKTERYKDDLGNYWYSDDKGETFYQ